MKEKEEKNLHQTILINNEEAQTSKEDKVRRETKEKLGQIIDKVLIEEKKIICF